jgi:hypothetical protein
MITKSVCKPILIPFTEEQLRQMEMASEKRKRERLAESRRTKLPPQVDWSSYKKHDVKRKLAPSPAILRVRKEDYPSIMERRAKR